MFEARLPLFIATTLILTWGCGSSGQDDLAPGAEVTIEMPDGSLVMGRVAHPAVVGQPAGDGESRGVDGSERSILKEGLLRVRLRLAELLVPDADQVATVESAAEGAVSREPAAVGPRPAPSKPAPVRTEPVRPVPPRPVRPRPEPVRPEPIGDEPTPERPHRLTDASPIRGVAVIHDHVFGSCEGRLVADRHGVRYETTHKDAFTVAYTNLERFEVDSVRHTLRVKPRDGRIYNFTDNVDTADVLSAFDAEVRRARTRLGAQDP